MGNCLYIVEGESEKQFLRSLQEACIVNPGRIQIFNLMQEDIRPANSILAKRYSQIICIIDTDIINEVTLNRFMKNIKLLNSIGKTGVLIQNKNFEDELTRILKTKNIYTLFKIRTDYKNVLKHKFTNFNFATIISPTILKQYGINNDEFLLLLRQHGIRKTFIIKTGSDILSKE